MFRMVLFNSTMDIIDNNTMYLSGNYSPVIVFSEFMDFYNVYDRVYRFYGTGN